MTHQSTRRGQTQNVVNKNCHSRESLSGIYNACRYHQKEKALLNRCVEDPRLQPSGMTILLTTAKAFTLIELLVVVLIIGILAAVAVPQYQKAVLKSRLATIKPIAQAIAQAQEVYYLTYGQYATTFSSLDIELPAGGTPNETDNKITYTWGSCQITDPSNTSCTAKGQQNIYYLAYHDHDQKNLENAGKRMCQAKITKTIAVQVCQLDTGKTETVSWWGASSTHSTYVYD